MYGFHIHKGKRESTFEALKEDISKYKISSAQIFVLNPRSTKSINLGKLDEIKKFIKKHNIQLYVHSSYMTTSMWNDKPFGIKLLIDQMNLSKKIKAKGLVVHLPKKSYKEVTFILKKYKTKINNTNIDLLLEHPTFKSDDECSYEMPFQLNRLTKHLNKIDLKKWGYTIDTAHLWSSITEDNRINGYTIETYDGADKWINGLDEATKNKIKLIHLNGSHNLCSSNKDKHAIPIYGTMNNKLDNIWGKYKNYYTNKKKIKQSGLYRFIKFAKLYKINIIIEMNVGTTNQLIKSLNVIKDLLAQLNAN